MAKTDTAERILRLLEPLAPEHGLELVTVEVVGGRRAPVVRVFLDREGGIDIEAIAKANGWISSALEEAEPIGGTYTLEVSSPGLDRPLRTREHYERFVGKQATLRMEQPVDGRGSFTGTLLGVEGDDVVIDVEGTTHRLPLRGIAKGRLKAEIDWGRREGSEE